jgi:hypothetical protein
MFPLSLHFLNFCDRRNAKFYVVERYKSRIYDKAN